MDDPPREWHSPGFGSLAASGFAFGLMAGLVGGVVYGGAVIWGAFLVGVATGDPENLGSVLGFGMFGAMYGGGIGLVVSIVGSLPTALLLAAWLHARRTQGRPLASVRWEARLIAAALVAGAASFLIVAAATANDWELGLVLFVVIPALATVVAAAVVADRVVHVGTRIHERAALAAID